jgi:hypothetical protein
MSPWGLPGHFCNPLRCFGNPNGTYAVCLTVEILLVHLELGTVMHKSSRCILSMIGTFFRFAGSGLGPTYRFLSRGFARLSDPFLIHLIY